MAFSRCCFIFLKRLAPFFYESMADEMPLSKKTKYVREPKQGRSSASLERLLNASREVLAEKSYAEFTLQEVSKRSAVSIGSMYCRFSGKEDLIRQVQQREIKLMDDDFSLRIHSLRRQELKLLELVPALIREFGEFLRKYKDILRPFMEVALVDEVIAKTGGESFHHTKEDFVRLIMECRDEIPHADPDRAVTVFFNLIYASLARYLGFGSIEELNKEVVWDTLLDDLTQVGLCYLLVDPKNINR